MSSNPEQSYATHRRWHPVYHFVTLPILGVNVLVTIGVAVWHFSLLAVWNVIVAITLLLLAAIVRMYATHNQDRIIRAEETARLYRVLPDEMRGRIGELRKGQLIALRFCTDEELPELVRAIYAGEVRGRESIKRRIKSWRADLDRV